MSGYGAFTVADIPAELAEDVNAWHAYHNWLDAYHAWVAAGHPELYGWTWHGDILRAPDGGPAEECLRLGHYLYWLWDPTKAARQEAERTAMQYAY